MDDSLVNQRPVFLIGYRGVGKSTVAMLIAEKLGWPALDADDEIERRTGQSIAQIFATRGEPAFRDIETQVVADLASREMLVVALGGGAVVRPGNRELLARRGRLIWLQASAEAIWQRLQTDDSTASRRPNLTLSGGLAEVRELLRVREPIYRECAHFVIPTEHVSPEAVAANIVQWLRSEHGH